MKIKVFVDGQKELLVYRFMKRLNNRDDIEILEIDSALRKDQKLDKLLMLLISLFMLYQMKR